VRRAGHLARRQLDRRQLDRHDMSVPFHSMGNEKSRRDVELAFANHVVAGNRRAAGLHAGARKVRHYRAEGLSHALRHLGDGSPELDRGDRPRLDALDLDLIAHGDLLATAFLWGEPLAKRRSVLLTQRGGRADLTPPLVFAEANF
jgi:hypothetical protein